MSSKLENSIAGSAPGLGSRLHLPKLPAGSSRELVISHRWRGLGRRDHP